MTIPVLAGACLMLALCVSDASTEMAPSINGVKAGPAGGTVGMDGGFRRDQIAKKGSVRIPHFAHKLQLSEEKNLRHRLSCFS